MAKLWSSVTTSWSNGQRLWSSVTTSWSNGQRIWAGPSAYVMPSVPPGGVLAYPTPGSVVSTQIAARQTYHPPAYAMAAVDMRDDSAVGILSATISTDDDSTVWTLRASASADTFDKLTGGSQPVTLRVTQGSLAWEFVVDSVTRTRAFNDSPVTVLGRSLTAAAGAPFQPESNWINDGATTGAQLAAMANIYTGVNVVWEIEDWIIPDKVFAFSGTPMAVVRRVAEAVGAVVRSARTGATLYVSPKYATLPNEWEVSPPNVTVAFEAVVSEAYERVDRPGYNGVYLSGQQGGAYGYVRLNGTNGAVLHPFVTELLLTDVPALAQRGQAILGASGAQAKQTIVIPVLDGAGEPGVVDLGMVVKVPDPSGEWVGMVRSVTVEMSHGSLRQHLEIERHTELVEGTAL